MKFEIPACPKCGQIVHGTHETMTAVSLLVPTNPGDSIFIHDGITQVEWHSQKTIYNAEGEIELVCPDGHVWTSKVYGIVR